MLVIIYFELRLMRYCGDQSSLTTDKTRINTRNKYSVIGLVSSCYCQLTKRH